MKGGKKRGKKKAKGRVKSKSGTFSHICVASRYAALSKRLSVLDETLSCERVMPRCSSLSQVCVRPHLAELERGLRSFRRFEARRDGARCVEDAEDDAD